MSLKKEPEKNSDDKTDKAKSNKNQARNRRLLLWLIVIVVLASILAYLIQPKAIVVDLHEVKKSSLIVSIDEEGQTRVRDVYTFSSPVDGKLDRIDLKVGDSVIANKTPLVIIHPSTSAFLDIRSEKQAQAAVDTAKSARRYANAEMKRVQSDLEFAKNEYHRAQELRKEKVIPLQKLEDAEHNFKAAHASLASARASVQMRSFELKQAEAMLMPTTELSDHGENCQCVPVTSSVNGKVLKIYDQSSRAIHTGEPLIDIGDAGDLEIVVDLLSADAVQVQVGNRVLINDWGGEQVLDGQVRSIEPFGVTKVSALGIEEQRVNVVIDLVTDKELWQRLGHGYQVGLKLVLWEADDVINIPLTAAFRKTLAIEKGQEDVWAVFVIEEGKVRVRDITLEHRSGLQAEVTSGLSVGEKIVLHPSNKVVDGVKVSDRAESF